MMVTIGYYVRRGQRRLRQLLMEPKCQALVRSAAYFFAGFFLSAASLAHRPQPIAFGLLCALSGWPALLMASGGMAGTLVFWADAGFQPVVWLMVGLVLSLVLGERRVVRQQKLLLPALAAFSVAATGLVFQIFLRLPKLL